MARFVCIYLWWGWASCSTFEWNKLTRPHNLLVKCWNDFGRNFYGSSAKPHHSREKKAIKQQQRIEKREKCSKDVHTVFLFILKIYSWEIWIGDEFAFKMLWLPSSWTYHPTWVQPPLVHCFLYPQSCIDTFLYHVDLHHR